MLKRLLCILSVLALFLAAFSAPAENDFSKDAWAIVDDIVCGFNIGNSMDAYDTTEIGDVRLSSETCWGNPVISNKLIDAVASTGVNAIRLPVTWYNHMDPETYKVSEEWMNRVEEVVSCILEKDMYCILNTHHDTGEKGWLNADPLSYEQDEKIFTALWAQIAERFEKYGEKQAEIPAEVTALAEQMQEARKVKDYQTADAIRAKIDCMGYTVLITREGCVIKSKN